MSGRSRQTTSILAVKDKYEDTCSSDEAGQQMALEDTTNNHGPNVPVCPSGGIRNRIRRNSGQSKTIHRQKRSTRITSDSAKTPDSKTVCFPVTSSNGQIRQLSGRQVSARSSIRNIVNERNSEEDDIRLGYKDGSPGGKAQTKVNRLGYRPVDGPPVARPPAGLSDSDAHDTDIEDEVCRFSDVTGCDVYRKACRNAGIVPCSYVMNHLTARQLQMNNRGLGPKAVKAMTISLLYNDFVTELELAGNRLGQDGVRSVCDLLLENPVIRKVDLSYNDLGPFGAKAISDVLKINTSIHKLLLSGNGFNENDAAYLADILYVNTSIKELDLSHNNLSEKGGVTLAAAIAANDTLEVLDLSWNHLRLHGAKAIGVALGKNGGIRILNLAWNGFADAGARIFGDSLSTNTTLTDLDLSNNRISHRGLAALSAGLDKNSALTTLKLQRNSFTVHGPCILLNVILKSKISVLKRLDLTHCEVTTEFVKLEGEVKKIKPDFAVEYGNVVRATNREKSDKRPKKPVDPFTYVVNYMKENNLRLMDLFSRFDKDKSWTITRDECRAGIKKAGIPLTDDQLDTLMERMDKNKDGEVDFRELLIGQQDYTEREREIAKNENKD